MNILKRIMFLSNEPCPCNSGKTYKNCCKLKPNRYFRSKEEFFAIISKCSKKSRIKICLAKGCKQKGKNIVKAHALQENRILSKLCVNDIVLMQNTKDAPKILEIKKGRPEPFYFLSEVYIKNATVSTCFCNQHDDKLFSKIEKPQFDLSSLNEEQKLLFAYRTFSFEYYKELTNLIFQEKMFTEVPQLTRRFANVQIYRDTKLKLFDLGNYKHAFEECLENMTFNKLITITKEIPYEIPFANYMCAAPKFDLYGRSVHNIDKKTKIMKRVFITAFPVEHKSYVLLSVFKDDYDIYKNYIESFADSPLGLIEYYLNTFIPLYSDNLILSPLLWDTFNETAQHALQYAVAENPQRSAVILKGVQYYLKNIHKAKDDSKAINTQGIVFDFFKDLKLIHKK